MCEHTTAFTECYVAFLDILGMKALVGRSAKDTEVYRNLQTALQEAKNLSTFRRDQRNIATGDTRSWSLQVQAFSDSVTLFIPTESGMLSWLLASMRRLHDRLIRLDVCLRGAITIGGMHWDSNWSTVRADQTPQEEGLGPDITPVAFGPGLITAYELEQGCAVYPRVIVSGDLCDHMESLRGGRDRPFPLAESGRLSDFVRQDFDGLWHFDVLHRGINRRDVIRQVKEADEQGRPIVRNEFDDTSYEDRLTEVGRFIARNLEARPKEPILAKYQWFARYFNEKARAVGVNIIPIFKDELPVGTIPLTITSRKLKP